MRDLVPYIASQIVGAILASGLLYIIASGKPGWTLAGGLGQNSYSTSDGDYHTRDLFHAIQRGDYPTWTLKMQIMPFEDAKTYRFNPFDLTKVWPHSDYPLTGVGRMTLDRNPTDNHAEIEQAAFEPSNLVPGIGPSPDKMSMGRMFSYPDAHRTRIAVNYNQLPVNAPKSPVHSYSKDGARRYRNVSDPVYAPNSKGGPEGDTARYGESAGWYTDGEMVHAAYALRAEDDDWGQATTMVRQVLDDPARRRLVNNIADHVLGGVSEPVLVRAFEYWRNADKQSGDRVEEAVFERRTVLISRPNHRRWGSGACRTGPRSR